MAYSFLHQPNLAISTHRSDSSTTTALNGIKGFRSWFESQFPDAILAMPRDTAYDEFDHLLIDMNQLLHVALRRSRSEGHALTLLMKELDACIDLALPKRSVVLAMDGPPSAAKLATQRRRRFSTVARSEWKQSQLKRFGNSISKRQQAKRKRRYTADTKTLCITPGTEFMERAQQALIYWAWQRMSNPRNRLANVRVYVSSDLVHGEGEVKLLEWILQRNRHGDSIAIMGGDSDLVLEALVIPPSSTHNVFVLLPDGNKKYLAVSVWETTRALSQFLPKLDGADMMRVRTDLVLLLIMNGNDYLPKLRGSSGFNKLFHTYLRLLHQWLDNREAHPLSPFLVDPDSLELNLPFCLSFFRHLAHLAPTNFTQVEPASRETLETRSRITALGQLNNLVESGFIAQPIKWSLVSPDDDHDEPLLDDEDGINDDATDLQPPAAETVNGGEQVLMRLSLGSKDSETHFVYEMWHDSSTRIKTSKQILAAMALDDLVEPEMNDESDDGETYDYPGISGTGYSWEIPYAAEGNVTAYLGGLLWNLQTYQDGVCVDYAYNYGRRMSPTANEVVNFLKTAMDESRVVDRDFLLGDEFFHPVSSGLACLAALPSQVGHLIPAPYSWLNSSTVEGLYASCMNPINNVFDMKKFECLCEDHIQQMAEDNDGDTTNSFERSTDSLEHHGRRILPGNHYWTIISRSKTPLAHPFDPPASFSDRLSELRPNNFMKVSRALMTSEPRPRTVWPSSNDKSLRPNKVQRKGKSRKKHTVPEVQHASMGDLLQSKNGKKLSIVDVNYKKAYEKERQNKKGRRKRAKFDFSLPNLDLETNIERNTKPHTTHKERERLDFDLAARMREFNIVGPPPVPVRNTEGQTALVLLNQLKDAKMIGFVTWDISTPSKSVYASIDPHAHENVRLVVGKGVISSKAVLHENLVYEQDRQINQDSRQAVKQHLATFALCDLVGPQKRWSEMTFKDLKNFLKEQAVLRTR